MSGNEKSLGSDEVRRIHDNLQEILITKQRKYIFLSHLVASYN